MIVEATDGRIYNPARSQEDEDEDAVPYLIIQNNGMQNDATTKDMGMEGDTDVVNISVLVVADDRETLAELASETRQCIRRCVARSSHGSEIIKDYDFSAGSVEYDALKPCCYQELKWRVETANENQ